MSNDGRGKGLDDPAGLLCQMNKKYTLWRMRAFAITWIAYAGFYLCRKNLAVAKVSLKEEFGFDNLQLGYIGTAYLATYAIGQFLNGVLGDKLGARITVGLGLLIAAISNFIFPLGTTAGFMMVLYGINGYAQATGWPGLVKTMGNWFSIRERGIVMAWWGTCYQLGSAIATAFAAYLLSVWGWRHAFFVPAISLFGIALLFLTFQREQPEDVGLPDIETWREKEPKEEAGETTVTQARPLSSTIRKVLSNPTVWLLGWGYFCLKLIRYSLMFWLPLYMVEQLGYKPDHAGYYSVSMEIGGFLGTLFAGYASDRLFGSRRGPICALMFLGLALSLYAHTHFVLMGIFWNVASMALVGFMIYGPDSVMSGAAAMDFGTKEGSSTAAGFINGMGSVGAALEGILVGYVSLAFGWNFLFYILVGLALIGTGLMATRWKTEAPHRMTA
ncbi:MAG: MFS transporter [Deltaproteobacteria bacterium]|nr:MFS transporter [Deltaproteobacteria bacterium]MBI4373258.1 MFS transporter [Deltaproteobacteria bacterium]